MYVYVESSANGVAGRQALTLKVLAGFTIKFQQLKRMRLKVAHAIAEEMRREGGSRRGEGKWSIAIAGNLKFSS